MNAIGQAYVRRFPIPTTTAVFVAAIRKLPESQPMIAIEWRGKLPGPQPSLPFLTQQLLPSPQPPMHNHNVNTMPTTNYYPPVSNPLAVL